MGWLRCVNLKSRSEVKAVLRVVVILGVWVQFTDCSLQLKKPCGELVCQALEFCRQHDFTCQPCKTICVQESHNFDENRCFEDCQDFIHDALYQKVGNSTLYDLQRQEMEEKYKELEKDVLILKILVGVCIAVIAVVVASLVAFLVYFWKLMHPPQPADGEKKKAATKTELPTVYNNRYGVTTPTPENSPSSVSNYNTATVSPADTNTTTLTSSTTSYPGDKGGGNRSSPTKSVSTVTTPDTTTTTLSSTLANKSYNDLNNMRTNGSVPNTNRFRREPSESTLPDNCGYDNLSMSPQHYSVHV